MPKLFSYAFSLTPPVPPASPAPPSAESDLHEYAYSEFVLALPSTWRQVPTAEDGTLSFHAKALEAGLTISMDFFAIPAKQAQALAEQNLAGRLEYLNELAPGRVQVLQRHIEPHSGGAGLELLLVAEVPGEHAYLYLGYITARKVLNLTLVCKPDMAAAAALFDDIVTHFQPRLP